MLIDTNEIISSEKIYIKIEFKDGSFFERTIDVSTIKSIDLDITPKEHRKSIWDEEIGTNKAGKTA